jgi:hypothetical protein
VFFIGERDFDSMGFDLSGRNFVKIIAKDSVGHTILKRILKRWTLAET